MLTDAECKNATCPPEKKRARLACSGGLYLEISPAGSKRWFYKYRKDGKEGRMALGSYPDVGPKKARDAMTAAKLMKSGGRDPVQARKVETLKATRTDGDTFKVIALEWYGKQLVPLFAVVRARLDSVPNRRQTEIYLRAFFMLKRRSKDGTLIGQIWGVSKANRGNRWGNETAFSKVKPSIHAGFKESFN
jgi:hypothetical protein